MIYSAKTVLELKPLLPLVSQRKAGLFFRLILSSLSWRIPAQLAKSKAGLSVSIRGPNE
jgi:hypothetical protein